MDEKENKIESEAIAVVERVKRIQKINRSGMSVILNIVGAIGFILFAVPLIFGMTLLQTKAGIELLTFHEILDGDWNVENVAFFFIGFIVPIFVSVIGNAIEMTPFRNNDWKQKKNRFIVSIILYTVSLIIFAICWDLAREVTTIDYKFGVGITETTVRYDLGSGAIMSIIGFVLIFGASLAKSGILYAVAQGRISDKIFDFRFTSKENNDVQTEYKTLTDKHSESVGIELKENKSLADKLTELMKLKSDGIITEEEFQSKKEELLKKYE